MFDVNINNNYNLHRGLINGLYVVDLIVSIDEAFSTLFNEA